MGLLDWIKQPRSASNTAGRSATYNLLDNLIGFDDEMVTPGEAGGQMINQAARHPVQTAMAASDAAGGMFENIAAGPMAYSPVDYGPGSPLSPEMAQNADEAFYLDMLGVAAAPMAPNARGLLKNTPNQASAMGVKAPQLSPAQRQAQDVLDMPVKDPLVAHHNLSAEGVRAATDIGGIPMPSLAISRADYPLDNFGGITLLGDPSMVNPSRKTGVWDADVYTGRQPRGEVRWKNDSAASKVMGADPDLAGIKDAGYWPDMYDDWGRANEEMQVVQRAIEEGVVDVSKYDSFYDLARAAKKEIGYNNTLDETAKYPGLRKYGDTERVLWPEERFTPSGNRKKPQEYTLDRVMKQMNKSKAGLPATESNSTGPSQFRAVSANRFRNMDEVKASRGKIKPKDATEAEIEAYSNKYFDLQGELAGPGADYRERDRVGGLMQDIAEGNSTDWYGDVPKETADKIRSLSREAGDLPTAYFEAKPQRAVDMAEFPAAIVPADDLGSQKLLKDAGVREVLTYGTPAERAALFKKFPDLLFSLGAGAGGIGLMTGLGQANEDEIHNYLKGL